MVLLPVVIELADVFLVLLVPRAENFLLLMDLGFFFRCHRGFGRRRKAPESCAACQEQRQGKKRPDLAVGNPAIEQQQDEEDECDQQIFHGKHKESSFPEAEWGE